MFALAAVVTDYILLWLSSRSAHIFIVFPNKGSPEVGHFCTACSKRSCKQRLGPCTRVSRRSLVDTQLCCLTAAQKYLAIQRKQQNPIKCDTHGGRRTTYKPSTLKSLHRVFIRFPHHAHFTSVLQGHMLSNAVLCVIGPRSTFSSNDEGTTSYQYHGYPSVRGLCP